MKDCRKKRQDHSVLKNDTSQTHHATILNASATTKQCKKLVLFYDASEHMVCCHDYLYDEALILLRRIKLGNGKQLVAKSLGKLALELYTHLKAHNSGNSTRVIIIETVLSVPELHTNPLSCSALCRGEEKVTVEFKRDSFKAFIDGETLFCGTGINGVYDVNAEIIDRLDSPYLEHQAMLKLFGTIV